MAIKVRNRAADTDTSAVALPDILSHPFLMSHFAAIIKEIPLMRMQIQIQFKDRDTKAAKDEDTRRKIVREMRYGFRDIN